MNITPITSALVRGAAELEPTGRGLRVHRLPADARTRFPDPQLLLMEAQPSGARIVVTTSSRDLELVVHPHRLAYRGAERARGAIDLVVDGELIATDPLTGGDVLEVDLQTGRSEHRPGASHVARFADLPEGDKVIELWLPHNEGIELIELRSDRPVASAPSSAAVWMHHGSSISHGSNATSPARIWPAIAARRAGVELRNLGLGADTVSVIGLRLPWPCPGPVGYSDPSQRVV